MREYTEARHDSRRSSRRAERLKRARRIRRQRMFCAGVVCSLLMFGALVSVTHLNATAHTVDDSAPVYKYFTSYQIQCGDTLWTIAQQYHEGSTNAEIAAVVKEIRSINHLSPFDKITAGEHVVVPYYSTEYK